MIFMIYFLLDGKFKNSREIYKIAANSSKICEINDINKRSEQKSLLKSIRKKR